MPAKRKVRKALLCDIRMLVPFVWAQSVKPLYTEDTHNAAEDIGLLRI
jgi:hypothetical protein